MNEAKELRYLVDYLPFYVPKSAFLSFLLMKKDFPPPYSLQEPKLVQDKEMVKVVETCPYYSWMLIFEEIKETVKKQGFNYLQERHSLGWFIYLLLRYRPK